MIEVRKSGGPRRLVPKGRGLGCAISRRAAKRPQPAASRCHVRGQFVGGFTAAPFSSIAVRSTLVGETRPSARTAARPWMRFWRRRPFGGSRARRPAHSGEESLKPLFFLRVPGAGLEPACLAAGDFKSPASTDFATRAGRIASCDGVWRRGSESNRRPRLCRPLHDHSATPPGGAGADCAGPQSKRGKTAVFPLGIWSGRRVSNSRPQPWQGCALPTELLPHASPRL